MEESKKHIDDLFRDQLGDYTETPDTAVWEALENRLDNQPGKKRPFPFGWLWYIGMVLLIATLSFIIVEKITNHNNYKNEIKHLSPIKNKDMHSYEGRKAVSHGDVAVKDTMQPGNDVNTATGIDNVPNASTIDMSSTYNNKKPVKHTGSNAAARYGHHIRPYTLATAKKSTKKNVHAGAGPSSSDAPGADRHGIINDSVNNTTPIRHGNTRKSKRVGIAYRNKKRKNDATATREIVDGAAKKATGKSGDASAIANNPITANASHSKSKYRNQRTSKKAGIAQTRSKKNKPPKAGVSKDNITMTSKSAIITGADTSAAADVNNVPGKNPVTIAKRINTQHTNRKNGKKDLQATKAAAPDNGKLAAGKAQRQVNPSQSTVPDSIAGVVSGSLSTPADEKLTFSKKPYAPTPSKFNSKELDIKPAAFKQQKDAVAKGTNNTVTGKISAQDDTFNDINANAIPAKNESSKNVKTASKKISPSKNSVVRKGKGVTTSPTATADKYAQQDKGITDVADVKPASNVLSSDYPPKTYVNSKPHSTDYERAKSRDSILSMTTYKDVLGNTSGADNMSSGGGGGGNASPQNNRKKLQSVFEGGIKLGYEAGFGNDATNKFVISPYLQYNITPAISIMVQPGLKYDLLKNILLPGDQSFHKITGNGYDSSSIYIRDTVFSRRQWTYTYYQNYDSIKVIYKSSFKTNWEVEIPLMLKYKIGNSFYIYGGANLFFTNTTPQISKSIVTYHAPQQKTAPITYPVIPGDTTVPPSPADPASFFTFNTPDYGTSGNPYANSTTSLSKTGYVVGISAIVKRRILVDVMLEKRFSNNNVSNVISTNTYTQPYVRISVGYKLFGK